MVKKSATFDGVQKRVVASKKGGKHRDLHGRCFPKASLRALGLKYGAKHLSSADGKDVYELIDYKLYNVMENVIHDAMVMSDAMGRKTIKERDVVKAVNRLCGSSIGLATDEGRKGGAKLA